MRKYLYLLVIAIVSTFILSACDSGGDTASGDNNNAAVNRGAEDGAKAPAEHQTNNRTQNNEREHKHR